MCSPVWREREIRIRRLRRKIGSAKRTLNAIDRIGEGDKDPKSAVVPLFICNFSDEVNNFYFISSLMVHNFFEVGRASQTKD